MKPSMVLHYQVDLKRLSSLAFFKLTGELRDRCYQIWIFTIVQNFTVRIIQFYNTVAFKNDDRCIKLIRFLRSFIPAILMYVFDLLPELFIKCCESFFGIYLVYIAQAGQQ